MKLFGILHNINDGKLSVRLPKALKVSIGLGAKTKDLHVHIGPTGKWMLTIGGKVSTFDNMADCQEAYRTSYASAPDRKAPKKLPYYTFTRPGPDGQEPDFEAIAAHGPTPREIPVVVYGKLDDIYRPEMQMWGTHKLQCKGDGVNAQRLVSLARTPEEKARVVEGQRFFPVDVCATGGCKAAAGATPACKPHASFFFQLVNYPVSGGTTSYDTTGYAGIKALGGVLESCIGESVVHGMCFSMGMKAYIPREGSGTAYHATLRPTGYTVAEGQIEAPVVPPMSGDLSEDQQAALAQAFNSEFTDGEAL